MALQDKMITPEDMAELEYNNAVAEAAASLEAEIQANLIAGRNAYSRAINKSVSGAQSSRVPGVISGAAVSGMVTSRIVAGCGTNFPPQTYIPAHDWGYPQASSPAQYDHVCTVNEFDVAIEYMFGYCTICKKEVRLSSSPVSRAETRARKLTEEYLESRLAGLIADDDVGFQETVNELALLELLLEVDQDRIELARRLLGIVKKGIMASLGIDE